ncbi:MAG: hypothetical protein KDA51_07240, partial [Planctomycetales bacterium]|nr:hypothetical protein [Planctomycetales bacterium]
MMPATRFSPLIFASFVALAPTLAWSQYEVLATYNIGSGPDELGFEELDTSELAPTISIGPEGAAIISDSANNKWIVVAPGGWPGVRFSVIDGLDSQFTKAVAGTNQRFLLVLPTQP